MKIYLAGMDMPGTLKVALDEGAMHLMTAFVDTGKKQAERLSKCGADWLLDSGAFSAWKKGTKITVDEYVKFLYRWKPDKYINLDVIGDAKLSSENLKALESNGLNPIPVYHYGSEIEHLESLIHNYSYIALGGTVGLRKEKRKSFFDTCFDYDVDFHGLGMTDLKLMKDYPWHSVDSTTWLIGRKFNKRLTDQGQKPLIGNFTTEEKIRINIRFLLDKEKEVEN